MATVVAVEDEREIAAITAFRLGREGHSLTMLECAGALTDPLGGSKPEPVVLDSTLSKPFKPAQPARAATSLCNQEVLDA